jgi:hypothetical protein
MMRNLIYALFAFSLVLAIPTLAGVLDDFFDKLRMFFGKEQAVIFMSSLAVYCGVTVYSIRSQRKQRQ